MELLVSENAKLLAENIALREEVERLRALIPDEEPMEEDLVLTSDEEEEEEKAEEVFVDVGEVKEVRPRICPLEIARVKAGLTKVWDDKQCVDGLYKQFVSFWDITTKQLSGERKERYTEAWQRRKYGEFYQYCPGVKRFSKAVGYSRKFHLNAKEKEMSKKIMDSRRANPNKYTTTDDIRALAKKEGYTITKSQEKTLQHWDKSDWRFEKLMEQKVIYAYEYVIHYTKGGGMRVMMEKTYSASRTRAWVDKDAEGVKRGEQLNDYCRGNIILRKKK